MASTNVQSDLIDFLPSHDLDINLASKPPIPLEFPGPSTSQPSEILNSLCGVGVWIFSATTSAVAGLKLLGGPTTGAKVTKF